MLVLITYDVNTTEEGGQKRLRKVAKECVNFGQRVQNSVFECVVDPAQFTELQFRLKHIIDHEKDSIRFYFMGSNWSNKVDFIGKQTAYDVNDTFII
ncbi:MAG: CRISPR-associated endonuclease Cas2 [Bacteroidales bacterium]